MRQNIITSAVLEADYLYPLKPFNNEGWLKVEVDSRAPHELHWEEYGNPNGEPVVYLHGGPGGGCSPRCSRFFNPARYRIILFDQRGCGQSRPNVKHDRKRALTHNTTAKLVDDVFKLRAHLGIKGKMHVFGGSWGSTLAMSYAIKYAETVQTLILRGIFLGRRQDLAYLYQGNAATYSKDPHGITEPGAYTCYPETWGAFVQAIPVKKRGNMIKAYNKIFSGNPTAKAARNRILNAATAWSVWEGSVSNLIPDPRELGGFEKPEFALCFASIEAHYFKTGSVFPDDENYLLNHARKFANVPAYIVHGRFDQVCPLLGAEALAAELAKGNLRGYIRTLAGHSEWERENYLALTAIMDSLPRMKGF